MSLFTRLFFRRRETGKELAMAEANNGSTQPAANGGIDYDKLGDVIASKLSPALGAALKPLEQLPAALEKLTPVAAPAAAAANTATGQQDDKPLTAAQVQQWIADGLKTHTQQQQSAARDGFIASRLSKLPKVYQSQLGRDPAKWEDEAKSIQQQYEADFKIGGGATADVTSATRDGGTAASQATVDVSKLSPLEKIQQGLGAK